MEPLAKRIRLLREEKQLTQIHLAKVLNIENSTLSQYESGQRTPSDEVKIKIADYFKVSLDFLLGRSEERLIKNFNIHSLVIPVLGTIRVGLLILAQENREDEIEIPSELQADFALRVKGDSMSWVGIHEGDLALMRQVDTASHGMIVAAIVQDVDCEATLKFYIQENGQFVLRAANPAYEDIKITDNHRIIGQLVKVIKKPPSFLTYKNHLVDKELADKGWTKAIEKGVQMGFNGESLEKAIEVLGLVKKG
ncbi:LexA family protein [Candidatus Formimonas warabiya]|uniref:HTH cro/C1-type domain-containing protein n=1 Tax=Formimonas warabiya TaxID=1761012 RepID=A0A3G1KWC2_FORW1|nr:LexA family transcriptional regulator [Candidatus Formimonas warabiya]ATW26746.1 hypothetical protein DCMF_20035 [Candidatus Formimonas warabiya]